MQKEYKIVENGGEGEIIEKKSRFISTVRPVADEEEALAFIDEMRKKYWNASHNCYAYVIGEHKDTMIMRCSDDGEPGQTAGKPMLDVLLGENLRNTAVVVTRYFGGTLLGTGGLVRAYSKAVQEGLNNSEVAVRRHTVLLEIHTDYNGIGKIQYLLGQRGLSVGEAEYTDKVRIQVPVPFAMEEELKNELTEATNGQAKIEKIWEGMA
jgi:uncharacterized YigZ family protein